MVENRQGQSDFGEIVDIVVPEYCQQLLRDSPLFIAEMPHQRLRKLILETIFRLPATDPAIKRHEREISTLCFSLIEIDNEENVQIALKILIELYKQCRPNHSAEVKQFLRIVRKMYQALPEAMDMLFENPIEIQPETIPDENRIGQTTKISYHDESGTGNRLTRTVIPKATNSLLVLQDLPIAVVLMYQLYRESIEDLFQLVIATLSLAPSQQARQASNFRRELYITLIGVQVKTLSLVAYFVRLYTQDIMQYSDQLLVGMLNMLRSCPPEATPFRKELIIAVRHISNTDLKQAFVPHLEQLFNDEILFGSGLTVKENLRPLGYHVIAELVHQLRHLLPYSTLTAATHAFLTNLHDDTLQLTVHVFSAKLIAALVDCIRQTKTDGAVPPGDIRALLLRIFCSFTERLHTMAKFRIKEFQMKNEKTKPEDKTDDEKRADDTIFQENKQLLKLLIYGAKHVTTYLFVNRIHNAESRKEFGPYERTLYIKFGKNALQAFDLYLLHSASTGVNEAREKEMVL